MLLSYKPSSLAAAASAASTVVETRNHLDAAACLLNAHVVPNHTHNHKQAQRMRLFAVQCNSQKPDPAGPCCATTSD